MAVTYEEVGNVRVITLDRPEARNAVSHEVSSELEEHLDTFEADEAAWVAVLAANGPVFSAGADLKSVSSGKAIETEKGGFAGLVRYPRTKPLIAAVDGPALAGGLEIVLSCDLVVASTAAQFGIPEVKRSLIAGAGGLFRLPASIARNVAMELALTGDPISAERAFGIGLVNEICEPGEVVAAALDLARRITVNAPIAVRESRKVLLESQGVSDEEGWQITRDHFRVVLKTEDFQEGPLAFVEKRPPVWKGR
ncbi:MAG: crotonase/enoyl-CoA hydratase family protein [Actinomycetota bacterium]|jgi:enoyl-CoA hydratase|nr:crotonase/enoyl-CoA hydratase family protein [Acidimicrobiales bacterium]MEC8975886.1 crotonase/enoyl-CoA hydratase family protein [Actinomycetota bacterium]MED6304530.1 crotonase/enoyl-CoA hydratase family protein [Actinomycetota bacterium]